MLCSRCWTPRGTPQNLPRIGNPNILDISQSEVVLPLHHELRVKIPGHGIFVCELTASKATNAFLEQRFQFAIAKGVAYGDEKM